MLKLKLCWIRSVKKQSCQNQKSKKKILILSEELTL